MAKVLIDEIIPALKAKMLTPPVETADIADEAVTAAKADVAGIMNSAGANGQLFGLGGEAILISNTDLNNLQNKSGLYHGDNLTNAPITAQHTWYYIQQIVHNAAYAIQIAIQYGSGAGYYVRQKNNGTWSSWLRVMTQTVTLNQVYPVGSVYITTLDTPEKVATALGGGTWVRTNTGEALVGFDSSQTEFNTLYKRGGAKTGTLALNHLPKETWVSNANPVGGDSAYSTNVAFGAGAYGGHTNLKTQSSFSKLPPYQVYYVYRRTV